jgi:hypothetical protein
MGAAPAEPTEQEWRALYAAAGRLMALGPWEWMLDADIFGVRSPETGEVGYCCVMGNLGEHYALALYLGDGGLRGYLDIRAGLFEDSPAEALFVQHCLQASFEDREYLTKADRDQIKALGLKFRGRNAWPFFRNYTPGYFPWQISGVEARFLTLAIDQTCEMALRFRDDPDLLEPETEGDVLVRELDGGTWREFWHRPDLTPPPAPPAPPVDELRLQRLRQAKLRQVGGWESGKFIAPHAVQAEKGERPYYPVATLFIDARTGMILSPSLADPEGWREAYQEQLIGLIEQGQAAPREIAIVDAALCDLLAPICATLKIKLKKARATPLFDEAKESLFEYFMAE